MLLFYVIFFWRIHYNVAIHFQLGLPLLMSYAFDLQEFVPVLSLLKPELYLDNI
jgi:hypothetical protein